MNLNSAFTMVVPNICNDMHSCPVSTGDDWLRRYVPMILASTQYQSGSWRFLSPLTKTTTKR